MINLLPLTKVIAAISVLYAAFISIILFFAYDVDTGVTEGIIIALAYSHASRSPNTI